MDHMRISGTEKVWRFAFWPIITFFVDKFFSTRKIISAIEQILKYSLLGGDAVVLLKYWVEVTGPLSVVTAPVKWNAAFTV